MNNLSENQVYNELVLLRDEIKKRKIINGQKTPRVCDDNALRLLAHYRPKTKADMMKITGLGEKFDEEYSEEFLKKLNSLETTDSTYFFTPADLNTLKKLENRLVNISQSNRLLYAGKINKNFGLDLYETLGKDRIDVFEKYVIERSNTTFNVTKINDIEDKKLKEILKLIRTAEKNETETGSNDLYVAYPFAEGKTESGDFLYKAPLILFPVKLLRKGENIVINNDFDRDIIYNTTLILANNKFNGKNEVLPDSNIEEYNAETFIDDMLKFYSDNKIQIKKAESEIEKFLENRKIEFPPYNSGEIILKKYMTLGLYTSYISSMYTDFQSLIDSKVGTKLIADLLWGLESHEKIENNYNNEDIINENEIKYINEVDSSQEEVLSEVKKGESLVIQGPPGTGKSQTITSIIAEKILEGKNVLMVSEKKTALDVIYSRLGKLSEFGIILDDSQNKTEFYSQVESLVSHVQNNNYIVSDTKETERKIDSISDKINDLINHLKEISDKVYTEIEFGTSVYNLFSKCQKYDFSNEQTLKNYTYLKTNYPGTLKNLKYQDIENCHNYFIENDFSEYLNICNKYTNYTKIKNNLTDSELELFKISINKFKDEIDSINRQGIIKKLLNKNKILKNFQSSISKTFTFKAIKDESELVKRISENPNEIIEFINIYRNFISLKYKYDQLDINKKNYLEFINLIINNLKINFKEANDNIQNFTYYMIVENYEKESPEIERYIDNFESIIEEIKKYTNEKMELTKLLSYNILLNNLQKLDNNGKFSKINEAINKKRKPAINKFMDKYSLELMDSIKIWLMTPEVVSDILPFVKDKFDLVIFDEASQLYLEKAIPAVYRANKIVVAGDKKQLKPSSLGKGRILDETEDDLEEQNTILEYESLLEASEYKFKRIMLKYHYRSIYSELIAFSNHAFYKGKLLALTSSKAPKETPIERFVFKEGRWEGRQNEVEAREVVNLVKKVLKNRKNNETVGVITFNSAQMDLIEDILERERHYDSDFNIILTTEQNRIENGENKSFFVKNIETVQGDERDIIIFCIGYAKNETGKVSINFGWLNQDGGENRLNVAISRAKKKIYVITSIEPEELIVNDTKNDGPKLFKKYLEYVKAVSTQNKVEVDTILSSLSEIEENTSLENNSFEENICNKLMENGYKIVKNYGAGGYKIDIAVQDENSNNLLALEFDGKAYLESKKARDRDYHKRKYLEARGWKVYRIWTSKWWKNPNEELEKLLNYISNIKE